MKKTHLAALAGAAVLLCGGLVYASGGGSDDPFVSLDYLENTYLPSLLTQVDSQVEESVSASYEKAAAKISTGTGSSTSVGLTADKRTRSDTITLTQGATFTMPAGAAEATASGGELIDATTGEAGTWKSIQIGHTYLVGEGATAKVTVKSDAASFLLEGTYTTKSAGVTTATGFTDLVSTEWYYSYVTYAYHKGLLTGVSATSFAPKDPVTRGMLAMVLYRMAGQPTVPTGETPFSDVSSGVWYAAPITWAAGLGIAQGVGEGLYAPLEAVTREQMAVMLRNYAETYGGDVSAETSLDGFSDSESVSSWSKDALSWAVAKGILNGRDDGTLDPTGTATRSEVCAVLQRFLAAYP